MSRKLSVLITPRDDGWMILQVLPITLSVIETIEIAPPWRLRHVISHRIWIRIVL
jgi:hypothetical protein